MIFGLPLNWHCNPSQMSDPSFSVHSIKISGILVGEKSRIQETDTVHGKILHEAPEIRQSNRWINGITR